MVDLWSLARSSWPGALPDTCPADVHIEKRSLRRFETLHVAPGALVIVLSGSVAEWAVDRNTAHCILEVHGSRDIVLHVVGTLRADISSDVLVFSPGWERGLPQAARLLAMLREAAAHDYKHRIAELMCTNVRERVERHVLAHCLNVNTVPRRRIALRIGASREMVSRILAEMASADRSES